MPAAEQSDLVQWQSLDVESAEFRKCVFGVVKRGVEGSRRKRFREKQEDAFCAASLGEIVVDECD